jgi:hypothetical protein
MSFGYAGAGKSVDGCYSFPTFLNIAVPGALQPCRHVCGYTPVSMDLNNLVEATQLLNKLAKEKHQFDGINFDDFSLLMQRTLSFVKKEWSHLKGWQVYTKINELAYEFRNTARYHNKHVMINCWEKPPDQNDSGHFVRGGAQMSGKLPEQFAALCDLVLRCDTDQLRGQTREWNGIYRCRNDNQYTTKDRFGICYRLNPIPMNLREILNAAGFELPRLQSLPWQEQAVESISTQITNGDQPPLVIAKTFYSQLLKKGIEVSAAKWTIRDALDRSDIRQQLKKSAETFI